MNLILLPLLFSPSQDGWEVLVKRYDKNEDGKITLAEYPRGRSKFTGYDRDADGVLTAADFEGTGGMDFGRMRLGRSLEVADGNKDGKISAEEWLAWITDLKPGEDGAIPQDRFEYSGRGSGSLDRNQDGKITVNDLQQVHHMIDTDEDGTLSASELSGMSRGSNTPQVGQEAPDFDLAYAADEKRKAKLSSFAGTKPVALVFGSYT